MPFTFTIFYGKVLKDYFGICTERIEDDGDSEDIDQRWEPGGSREDHTHRRARQRRAYSRLGRRSRRWRIYWCHRLR